jgi:hypothetical protein
MNAKCERISVDPAESNRFDRPLIKAVARARRWSNQVLSGQVPSIRAIARQERIAPRYVRDLLPLAFLSPRIIEAILEGRQPPDLTVVGLTRRIDLPLLWSVQERAFGLRDSTRLVTLTIRRRVRRPDQRTLRLRELVEYRNVFVLETRVN